MTADKPFKDEQNRVEGSLNRNDKIARAFNEIEKESPSYGFGISFLSEDTFSIYCASYENYLNDENRRQNALRETLSIIDGLVKRLKENYKKEYKELLAVKILGEGSDVEQMSQNGKYKLTVKRLYSTTA